MMPVPIVLNPGPLSAMQVIRRELLERELKKRNAWIGDPVAEVQKRTELAAAGEHRAALAYMQQVRDRHDTSGDERQDQN